MSKIYIDVDDVVRGMGSVIINFIGKKPKKWSDGEIIFKIVKENPDILIQMGVTEYFQVIKNIFKEPTFLSAQIDFWRPYTDIWLQNHFSKYDRIFVNNSDEKLKYLKEGDLLIDDSPQFNDFSQVVLIDKLYNQHIKNPYIRIKNAYELDIFLKEVL